MLHRLLALAALLALGTALHADIAPNPLTTGGTNLTIKEPPRAVPIQMVWEEVDLYPSAQKNRVEALFLMKNTGKEDVELTVGFPSYFRMPLEDFTLEVDGKKQLAEIQKSGPVGRKNLFTYWMCWPMKFAGGTEYKIRVTYWCKTDTAFPPLYVNNLPRDLKAQLQAYSSGYVVRTGGNWQGKIGKATFRFHYGDEVKKGSIQRRQPARGWKYDEKANQDVLVLSDFKPNPGEGSTADISYDFRVTTDEQEARLLLAALKKKELEPWAMQRLLELVDTKNALNLAIGERKQQVSEIVEWMVPPRGPTFVQIVSWDSEPDTSTIAPGAEIILKKAYERLLDQYKDQKKPTEAAAVARAFEPFLKTIIDRNAASFQERANQRGPQWQEHRAMVQQHAALVKFLK